MHLARVTYHSTRSGLVRLDGNLSKSNDTLRINLGNRRPLWDSPAKYDDAELYEGDIADFKSRQKPREIFDVLILCE